LKNANIKNISAAGQGMEEKTHHSMRMKLKFAVRLSPFAQGLRFTLMLILHLKISNHNSKIPENFLFPISYFLYKITLWKPEHINGKWEIGNPH